MARDGALLKPLILGFAVVLLLLAFAYLGGEVVEGETRMFDMDVLRAAQNLRSEHPWITSAMRDLSGLGSVTVLALLTLASVGYLLLVSARRTALILTAAYSLHAFRAAGGGNGVRYRTDGTCAST